MTSKKQPTEPIPPGPQVPRREVWHDLHPEEYPGFQVKLWANPPWALRQDIYGEDNERRMAALRAIVVEHNGWRDHEGEPYPPASSPEFWGALPQEMIGLLLVAIDDVASQLPNSLRARRVGSGSSSARATKPA